MSGLKTRSRDASKRGRIKIQLDDWLSQEAVIAGAEFRQNTMASVVPRPDEIVVPSITSPPDSGAANDAQDDFRTIELKSTQDSQRPKWFEQRCC